MWFVVHPIQEMKQGVFFVDQSKTGSTTMGEIFWHAICISRGHIGSYHQTSKFLKFNYPKWWEPYHTFSVVRNPFDRFVSAFFFKADMWLNYDKAYEREISKKAVYDLMEKTHMYAIRPQHEYITDDKGEVIVDQLIDFEKKEQETAQLIDSLRVPFVDVKNGFENICLQKTRGKKDWRYYYEQHPDLWHIVSDIYKKDIEIYLGIGGKIDV